MTAASKPAIRVVALVGSLRAKSLNRALLRAAQEVAPADMALTPYLPIDALPFFNEDIEAAGDPAPVLEFRAAIQAAEALLLVTPEYNSGTSAVLKNAIDWASRRGNALKGMPVALASASPGALGGARVQAQLRLTLSGLGAMVMPAPDFLAGGAGARFNAEPELTDPATRSLLAEHLARFAGFARMLRPQG